MTSLPSLRAWPRRHNLRLVDALYAQLADDLDVPRVTTDARRSIADIRGELIGLS
jgi:predicted nucleic acid-binding protein